MDLIVPVALPTETERGASSPPPQEMSRLFVQVALIMAVERGAADGSSASESSQGALEIVLSGVDAGQSPCLASTTAGRLRETVAGAPARLESKGPMSPAIGAWTHR